MNTPTKFIYDKSKSVEVIKGYIVDNYLSENDGFGYSSVRTHLDGTHPHPYMKNTKSNRTYYIITGDASFYFEDKVIDVNEGEMISIPRNTKYAFSGKFDALIIDCPAFNPNNDIIYDEEIKI